MNPDSYLAILYGVIIGVSLGMTGGGGSIFAVPLLIYGLGMEVREAIGISLASVGVTAFFGAVIKHRSEQIEFSTAMLFALAGMVGAPIGTYLGGMISEGTTLVAFALLMLVMGFKMWSDSVGNSEKNGTCVRDIGGELRWSSPCAVILVIAGFSVGVLSGVFGVGGGVLIVPALVFIAKMPVHRAVATSLLVIALTCLSGALSYLWLGDGIPLPVTLYFIGGGLLGMLIGGNLEAKFSSSIMRRVFALAMWGIAIFVLVDNLLPGRR